MEIKNNSKNKKSNKTEYEKLLSDTKRLFDAQKNVNVNNIRDKNNEEYPSCLKIQEEFYMFRYKIWQVSKNFPKWERSALTSELKKSLLNFDKYISHGRFVPSLRMENYKKAQAELFQINTILRLAYDLNYFAKKFMINISLHYSLIGKMLTQLIKSETSRIKRKN